MNNDQRLLRAIDDIQDNSVEHHGIKGMKWGVRKWYSNSKLADLDAQRKSEKKL